MTTLDTIEWAPTPGYRDLRPIPTTVDEYDNEFEFVPPRYSSPPIYDTTRGIAVWEWAEQFLTTLKGPWAGQDLVLLLWQKWLMEQIFEERPDGRLRYRQGLVGVGRQNGKSIDGSVLGLSALFTGPQGAEVYSAAGDRTQARIVFNEARKQVLASPLLSRHAKVYRDAIEVPSTGAVYRVLSSDAKLQQGLSPYLVIFDEVHVQPNDDLWDALRFGMGARIDPLMLGITTAGDNPETLCGRLYEYGKQVATGEIDDETFGFWWWEPFDVMKPDKKGILRPELIDIHDPLGWIQANPSYFEGVLFHDDLEIAARQSLRPESFRRYRLNQWVTGAGLQWMNMTKYDACANPTLELEPGDPIVLGFDGSVNEDATALVAIKAGGTHPRVIPIATWERKPTDGDDWQVPVTEVDDLVDEMFNQYTVVKMGADPAYWRKELQGWQERYGAKTVLEWPVTDARMGPACTEVYKRVMQGPSDFEHNADATMRRHVQNARTKNVRGGHHTIKKDKPKSEHKIDTAAAMVIAVDMWTRYKGRKTNKLRSM